MTGTPLLATVHPAFVLRARRWEAVFRSDVAKAVRHAKGALRWRDPDVVLDPTLGQLDAALARLADAHALVVVDTETDGLDPEQARLRCVGLATESFGVVAAFRSCVGPDFGAGLYVERDGAVARPVRARPGAAVQERLRNFFALQGRPGGPAAIGVHNQVYDQPVLRRYGMPLPDVSRVVESIMLHKSADSEMPHDLDWLASALTDAPKWKPGHGHDAWRSDRELHEYCLKDCAVAARLAPGLRDEVVRTDQQQVYRGDLELQRMAIGMHRAGIAVDKCSGHSREEPSAAPPRTCCEWARHRDRLAAAMRAAEVRCLDAAGSRCPHVSSNDQVRDYLYKYLGVTPPSVTTPLGESSVSRDAVHELLRRDLPAAQRAFLDALLDFRRAQKAKTAFVDNLDVGPDGRVHATFNPHSNKSGRINCSAPNLNTIPDRKQDADSLRSMFVAPPGRLLVGADYDQVHMRVIGVRAPIPAWLECFERARGGDTSRRADIHYVNAALFYGADVDRVEKYQRSTVKTLTYAAVYGAGVETIQEQMARTRDPVTGERPFARMTHRETEALRRKFLRTYPEIERWWHREVAAWRAGGEVRSMIYGRLLRLRDLRGSGGADAGGLSEIVNGSVLMTEADLAGGNGAAGSAMRLIGWPWWGDSRGMGGAGLIMHIYDAIYAEVDAARVDDAKAALREAMQTTLRWEGQEAPITCKPKSGRRWSDLA